MQDDNCDKNDAEKTTTTTQNSSQKEDNLVTLDISDIPGRYRDVCPLGCGSKGLVLSVVDHGSLRRMAVKRVNLKNTSETHKLRQILREIRILHRLDHQNIVKIYHALITTTNSNGESISRNDNGVSVPRSIPNKQFAPRISGIYIGMELMDTDLHNIIQKTKITLEYISLFMYQLLRGLKYIHSASVIHRDITPKNIFVNMDTLMLKIGDFGVSRIYDEDYNHSCHLSMTTSTKSYHSPELLLHPRHYTKAADMWSAGCILAEMIGGKPIFKSEHSMEQMNLITSVLPVTNEDWMSVTNPQCNSENCCASVEMYESNHNDGSPLNPLEKMLPDVSSSALNLLKLLLCFDPLRRVTADDALSHPFFASYFNPLDEPVCTRPFRIEDELDDFSAPDLEAMLQAESYSLTSSMSKSDTNASQPSNLNSMENASSPNSNLNTNASYRSLLSLADNCQQHKALSESEARTLACDFEYGVQIQCASLNKDRMSLDFQPISSNADCYDPYKWNSKSSNLRPNATAPNLQTQKIENVSHSDHGYHSSYCSTSANTHSYGPTRTNTVHSSTLWSLSSPEGSDQEKGMAGRDTPDAARTPDIMEDEDQPSMTSRHSEVSLGSSTSRRHHHHSHHHHHHHHSHHHHHHKHRHHDRDRHHNTTPSSEGSTPVAFTTGSSNEITLAKPEGRMSGSPKRRRSSHKRTKKISEKSNEDSSDSGSKKSNGCKKENCKFNLKNANSDSCLLNKNKALVKQPGNEIVKDNGGEENKINKDESIHEHLSLTNLQKGKGSTHSAFKKYVSSENVSGKIETSNNQAKTKIDNISDKKKTTESVPIKKVNDLPDTSIDFFSKKSAVRPRTWSEGCKFRRKVISISNTVPTFPDLPKNTSNINEGEQQYKSLHLSFMHRLRTQIAQMFPIGAKSGSNISNACCLPTSCTTQYLQPETTVENLIGNSHQHVLHRIRHFSDDRRFVSTTPPDQLLFGIQNPSTLNQSDLSCVSGTPPPKCSTSDSALGGNSLDLNRSRVECPF